MKRFRLVLLMSALVGSPAYAQTIEEMLQERIDAGETPGIVAAVFKDGKTNYYAYGYADLAAKRLVNSKTLFEIGSITKTFTTISLAHLAEEGKLSLDDPAQKYLPEGVTIPSRNEKVITLSDLASARSGLPRMPGNFTPADGENPYLDYTEDKMFAFITGYTLTRDIGSQYEYSNLGMGLLGVIVSRVEGKPYREVVASHILKPLKMSSTFLNTPGRTDKNSAFGYSDAKAVKAWTWSDASCVQGAGGLLSNAEDMMKYLLANMNPSDNALGRAIKNTHQARFDIGGPSKMKIGLGWHIRNNAIVWHNGGTGGFRTFAGFDAGKKIAVVILTNSTTGADDLGFHLLDESIPLKKIRRPVAVSSDILKAYVGTYEIIPSFKIEVTLEGNQLMAQATGQQKNRLYPESETMYFLKVVDAQVEFKKDSIGNIEKLILYQGGQVLNGIRKN